MLKRFTRLLAALSLAALVAAPAQAGKNDPLYTPEPIPVPAGKSGEEVKKAVKKALFDKGWEARDVAAGHVQAKYTKSGKRDSYTAVIDVKFDSKTVRISYRDSENLNYNKENGTIHGTYNRWVRNVEKNVRSNLGAY